MICVMFFGEGEGNLIIEVKFFKIVQQNSKCGGYCDFNFFVIVIFDNVDKISFLVGEVGFLFIFFNYMFGKNISKVVVV